MTELASVVLCLVLVGRLRRRPRPGPRRPDPGELAWQAMWRGIWVVTVPLLVFLGILRYAHGLGIPSPQIVALCIGVIAVALLGAEVELSGNVLLDALLLSTGLVAFCFTVINGLPAAWAGLNAESFFAWSVACICAALVARAISWVREET